MNPGQTPLRGLRVLDWTHVLAGPFAAYNLALLGADVVRVERVDGTELIRDKGLDPQLAAAGLGESFVVQGSGKRSLAIDARDARARAALHALIARADVLVENFRPGKLRALGFDPAELVRRHPRLIVCSITGFGQAGASSGRRAYDHVVQAASGLMSANADADGVPQRVGFPIIDYAVGMQAALAVLAALARAAPIESASPSASDPARAPRSHAAPSRAEAEGLAKSFTRAADGSAGRRRRPKRRRSSRSRSSSVARRGRSSAGSPSVARYVAAGSETDDVPSSAWSATRVRSFGKSFRSASCAASLTSSYASLIARASAASDARSPRSPSAFAAAARTSSDPPGARRISRRLRPTSPPM